MTPEELLAEFPAQSIIKIGKITYDSLPRDRSVGQVVIVNHKLFALLFPCEKHYANIWRTPKESRNPTEAACMEYYLHPLVNDNLHDPFLHYLAYGLEDDNILDWSIQLTYIEYEDVLYRAMLFFQGPDVEDPRPYIEYAGPVLTRTRMEGPHIDIEVSPKEE